MAYHYSNPYQNPSPASRSTFNAAVNPPAGHQVLFSGLPLDVVEKDLRDLLINPPLALAATSTIVKGIYDNQRQFTGSALVSVSNSEDAERIRREYSGQNIDGTYRLAVQHILPPTQPLPAPSVVPYNPPVVTPAPTNPSLAPRAPRTAPTKSPAGAAGAAAASKAKPAGNGKAPTNVAPGLALLNRMKAGSSGAGPTGPQAALLAKQKANLKSSTSAASLLNRLGKNSPAAKVIAKNQARKVSAVAANGGAVGRAKVAASNIKSKSAPGPGPANGNKGGINKDRPAARKNLSEQDLDEQMRAYERQKRFGQ